MSAQNPAREPYVSPNAELLESTIAQLQEGKARRRELKAERLTARQAANYKAAQERRLKLWNEEIARVSGEIETLGRLHYPSDEKLTELRAQLKKARDGKIATEQKLSRINAEKE